MLIRVITLCVFAVGTMLGPCYAQDATKIPRIGFVAPQGRSLPLFDAFRKGLAELGYVDGQTVIIEPRFAEGQYERFPDIFSELVSHNVDVVAVSGLVTTRAAIKSVTNVPIVFSMVVDPVADNVVPSLEHPGGNMSGVTSFDPQQARKQLELLREVLPSVQRVGILGEEGLSGALIDAAEQQARALGLQPQLLRVKGPNPDLEGAFAAMKQQHADAVLVLEYPILGVHATEIADMAAKERLPTVFAPSRVSAAGLLFFGVSQTEAIRHMASYIDKILKGAKPGVLPVEKVDRYELIVNLKTASALGVTVPADVLKRADRVIQ